MKSFVSTFALLALIGAGTPTLTSAATLHNKSITAQVIVPVPTCPPDSIDPCGGPSPDDAGRTIIVDGGGLR